MTHIAKIQTNPEIAQLADQDLRVALRDLAARDRDVVVEMLVHLGEVDRRRSYLTWGYGSLWEYCRRDLKMSEGTAGRRVAAARALARYPEAAASLRDGRLNVCVLAVLGPVLIEANAGDVLSRAEHMSKRQAEALVMELSDKPVVAAKKDVVRLVAVVKAAQRAVPAKSQTPAALAFDETVSSIPPPVEVERVVDVKVHRVAFNAEEEVVGDLQRLQELLGHGDINQIVGRAFKALLEKVDPVRRYERRQRVAAKKAAKKANVSTKSEPKASKPKSNAQPRRQPVAVRDAAQVRDGCQCAYVSKDGVRCNARTYLHIDHIRPYALGGSSTDIDNSRVLCAAHNLELGRQTFGQDLRNCK
jgi:5-methylcytosine-specific restriction endonuclease McrA